MPTSLSKTLLHKLNEPGGKLFELLSFAILRAIYGRGKVEFQPRPSFMLIDPDLGVRDGERYEAIVLVTHATAKNAAGVKIDRSLEELFEAKTRTSKSQVPLAINLIWHSPFGWTKGHLARLDIAFDLNWVAFRDSEVYGRHLTHMVSLAKEIASLSHEESLAAVESSTLAAAFMPEMTHKIAGLSRPPRLHSPLWGSERARVARLPASAGAISNQVKLDLTSLSLLPPNTLSRFLTGKRVAYDAIYEPVLGSGGLVRFKSISENSVQMPAVLAARIKMIASLVGTEPIEQSLAAARDSEGFSAFFVAYEPQPVAERRVREIRTAADSSRFLRLLGDSWKSDSALFTGTCWPLEFAVALVQETCDRGYGLLTLQREALGDSNPSYGWDPLWRYVSGDRDRLNERELLPVCDAIVRKLARIRTKVSDSALARHVQLRIGKRLRRKKKANPLLWFVRAVIDACNLDAQGFPSVGVVHQCPFARLAGLPAISGSSTWHFRLSNKKASEAHTLLHVLSSYSSTHKHKEYAVKGRLVNYRANDTSVVLDDTVSRIGLLLDGEWTATQTELLRNAGVHVFSIDDLGSWVAWASK